MSLGKLSLIAAILVALALAFAISRIAQLPAQPAHPAVARVVAIVPVEGRWYANYDRIVVRAPDGTGQFAMLHADVRCDIGDEVPVEQRGVTLTRLQKTCR